MRWLKTPALLLLTVLCLTCCRGGRPSPFFEPAGFDMDSRVQSLAQKVAYMQSKLGFTTYNFEFVTPRGKNLVATFRAELDGSLVPELSGTYHVPPTGDDQNDRGWISINFFYPQYQTCPEQPPNWELHFNSGGKSQGWIFSCPFRLTPTESRGTSVSTTGVPALDDEQEHRMWEYETSPVAADQSAQAKFKYTLTIKLADAGESEESQEIRREDLK